MRRLRSGGSPSTEPIRSAIAVAAVEAGVRVELRRSRITVDFERRSLRDVASISAASASGTLTVSVFTRSVYYRHGDSAIRPGDS